MTHGSLFSGIGGFDLAASWANIPTVWQVEKDNFCQKVLRKNFPDTKLYGDIYEIKELEPVDIISGGFPCQPFSTAGKRKGTEDDRFLWNEMFRIIQLVKPSWVIAENVSGLITINNGLVLEQMLSELEDEDYETQPFVIPASAVNAPHKRDRIWIIAYSDSVRQLQSERSFKNQRERFGDSDQYANDTNTNSEYQQKYKSWNQLRKEGEEKSLRRSVYEGDWEKHWLTAATEFCRVDDGIPNRLDRIKALGNAIVPQIAYNIFKNILITETGGKQ